uniref:Oxidoreductase, aldo/keto reductase family n=1 Tax=uncultured bacterium contig00009 TaxID=1181501 RepID=A0A806KLT4_9BACT|nr:oxidoreductase, aldo/keto reductase family [uncultured bacterium contig00009]
MKQVILGKTGIEVQRLGFGGIPVQRVSEEQAVDAVLYALEKGMDFIDTSRVYTTSETRIGKALSQTSRKPAIATKSFCRAADDIRKDVEISLRELQRDVIDIYQCHSISTPEEYRKITSSGGAYSGLVKAREEGLIRHIGITSHSLDVLERALDDDLFETIMVCFSFLEPAAKEKVIPKALAKNVGILVMKPLSGGVIESSGPALKWAFGYPGTLVLAGVESRELIDQNWNTFQGSWELTETDRETIDATFREYDKKFCRRCDYCLPCPAGITIQYVLGARTFIKRMGAGALKVPMFADMWDKAEKCEECGQCVTRCPYGLPIPEIIKANVKWKKSLNL